MMEVHLADYVDKDRIICLGNSGGGTASFYVPALEERICMAVPSSSVCTYEDSVMAMYHCSCNYIPDIRKYFDMGDIGCMIAPRKLLIINGAKDEIFPVSGAEKCYEIIQKAYLKLDCEADCMMKIGDGGHQFYPELVWPAVREKLSE